MLDLRQVKDTTTTVVSLMNKRPVCITLEPLTPDPEVRLLEANLYNVTSLVLTFSLTEYIKILVNQVEWTFLMSMKGIFTV